MEGLDNADIWLEMLENYTPVRVPGSSGFSEEMLILDMDTVGLGFRGFPEGVDIDW